MKIIFVVFILAIVCASAATTSENSAPHLEKQHGVTQLMVDGRCPSPCRLLLASLTGRQQAARESASKFARKLKP